ncbi:UNVERIFIED_CONTAM: hypothetical protein GTU68_028088 [Idotea baltica]|nr:hypothetical protein [Idotea baltica]
MNEKFRILLVEDEEAIRRGLEDLFVYHGYEVESVDDGTYGLERALTGSFDLVVLDVMLPGLDGYSICNAIREKDRRQPIIMLTAKGSEEDILKGLTLGADDYVTKPFSVRELMLRAAAVLRRSDKTLQNERILKITEKLEIDTANLCGCLTLKEGENQVEFTRREVSILQYLFAHNDRPVPRGELLEEVWGYARADSIETRTVDIHIAKLRRKIELDPKEPEILLTVRGEGYKLKI